MINFLIKRNTTKSDKFFIQDNSLMTVETTLRNKKMKKKHSRKKKN